MKAAVSIPLIPFSWLYSGVMRVRRWLYRLGVIPSHQLPGQVIAIGNLEVGGTGKTPIVIALARQLQEQGQKPAILTRGYRSGLTANESAVLLDERCILAPQEQQSFTADEARLQSHHLPGIPIIIGANRLAAAHRYLNHYPPPSVWLMDDGFQHMKIKRDVNIVLLDATQPFANNRVLPAGRLRESPAALQDADIIVLTRASLSAERAAAIDRQIPTNLPLRRAEFKTGQPYSPLDHDFPGKQARWGLLIGIARPEPLITTLQRDGWNLTAIEIKPDHAEINSKDLLDLQKTCDAVLLTEKDYFRNKEIFTFPSLKIFTIPLQVRFDKELL
jgi:tetraacyldisaccharide 4'-kinase